MGEKLCSVCHERVAVNSGRCLPCGNDVSKKSRMKRREEIISTAEGMAAKVTSMVDSAVAAEVEAELVEFLTYLRGRMFK